MFIRALFKQEARSALRGRYASSMLAAAAFAVIPLILALAGAGPVTEIAALVVMGPLCFALIRYFDLTLSGRAPEVGDFFGGLTRFADALAAFLWQTLWVTLWLVLLIVPGLVKALSFSMQLFLLAEYPSLTARSSLNLSKKLTCGYKWELFVTNCSFIGWLLLSCLTGGLALLYVIPYYITTMAVIYHFLKENALADNRLSPAEQALLACAAEDDGMQTDAQADEPAPLAPESLPEQDEIIPSPKEAFLHEQQ